MAKRAAKKKTTRKKAGKKKRSKKKTQHRKPDPMDPGPERTFDMSLKDIEALAKLQCTHKEIAAFFGCSRSLVTARFRDDEDARIAWKKGKAMGVMSLRRRIWKKGIVEGDGPMLRHLANNYAGLSEHSTQRHAGHDGGPMPVGDGGMTADMVNEIKTKILGIPPENDDK